MCHFVSLGLTLQRALTFRLQRKTLMTLMSGVSFLLASTLNAPGQYPLLPFPSKYAGLSGEQGQIMLDGKVNKVTVFHGSSDDEADWHVYITLAPEVTRDLKSYLWSREFTFVNNCDEDCNLSRIYSELMVTDRHRNPLLDEFFYSADFTLPFLLSQPPPEKRPIIARLPNGTVIRDLDWTGEHPAWDLGLIAQRNQGTSHDFSGNSKLDNGRAYLQGAFVEDAAHRECSPPFNTFTHPCSLAPPEKIKKTLIEIHPLDSIAIALAPFGQMFPDQIVSVKPGEGGWPKEFVKWRVAAFANSTFHRIADESYLRKERTTTWYLELPRDAYNSWGDSHITVNVEEQPRRLWDGERKTWYFERGVKSFTPWTLAIDPKDGLKKLKISIIMNKPNEKGGIAVRDYAIRVTLHSNPDLGIRASTSNFGDARFQPGAEVQQGISNGATAVYYVRGQNQGPVPIQFRITGTTGNRLWTVNYFDAHTGGNNITSTVTRGGWFSPLIAGGASTPEYRIEVRPRVSLRVGVMYEVEVRATSSVDSSKSDIVKALTKIGSLPSPIP